MTLLRHPSGALRTCFLAEDDAVDGIPCRKGSFWGEITGGVAVRFHENGRLASCGLSRGIDVDGTRHRRWQRIRLDPAGRPLSD